eukprot:7013594-Lingulodinium_polyedra.AAC.1
MKPRHLRGLHLWTALELLPRRPRTVNLARSGRVGPTVQTMNRHVLNAGRWYYDTASLWLVYGTL